MAALLSWLTLPAAESCSEFLVHGVDVEGMQLGIDEELVELLGNAAPLPVTYAGGVRSLVRPSAALSDKPWYLMLVGLIAHSMQITLGLPAPCQLAQRPQHPSACR